MAVVRFRFRATGVETAVASRGPFGIRPFPTKYARRRCRVLLAVSVPSCCRSTSAFSHSGAPALMPVRCSASPGGLGGRIRVFLLMASRRSFGRYSQGRDSRCKLHAIVPTLIARRIPASTEHRARLQHLAVAAGLMARIMRLYPVSTVMYVLAPGCSGRGGGYEARGAEGTRAGGFRLWDMPSRRVKSRSGVAPRRGASKSDFPGAAAKMRDGEPRRWVRIPAGADARRVHPRRW